MCVLQLFNLKNSQKLILYIVKYLYHKYLELTSHQLYQQQCCATTLSFIDFRVLLENSKSIIHSLTSSKIKEVILHWRSKGPRCYVRRASTQYQLKKNLVEFKHPVVKMNHLN